MARANRLKPRKKPAQARSCETVAVILEAAARVFCESGYAAATTNHIAKRAGVGIGSLYQYFPNKDAILYSLMEKHVEDGRRIIEGELANLQAAGRVDREVLRRLVETMIRMHESEPELHRVLFEQVQVDPFMEAYLQNEAAAVDGLTLMLGRTPEDRKGAEAEAAVRLSIQAIDMMTHRFVLHGYRGIDRQAFVDQMTDMLSRFLLLTD